MMTNLFSDKEITFMKQRGSVPEDVQKQFSFYEKGFDFANLSRAATISDGIFCFSDKEIDYLIQQYYSLLQGKKVVKFVPASGAASRMFKELYDAMSQTTIDEKCAFFMEHLHQFAFYDDLKGKMAKDGYILENEQKRENHILIIRYLLYEEGLNYGNLPKGLLKFHNYDDGSRVALEEHLIESALYAKNSDNICYLHFTISPQYRKNFETVVADVKGKYEKRFQVQYDITYSVQSPATDTLAATLDNKPFKDKNENFLFRPGGHGALIANLNDIKADLVFVKNIDNVTLETKIKPTVDYKIAIAAYLLELQEKSFEYQRIISQGTPSKEIIDEILYFMGEKLQISYNETITPIEIFNKLHRPMRVCGVVKNEGEPGGGPFWVTNHDGITSCQIVESSQVDISNSEQKKIMTQATHFNPVDMVCSYRDFQGNYFHLPDYVDPFTGFISQKSHEGKPLKAMELPGLWNGAMAHWITIFVEVPLATFNPVKTVFDLLKR